MAGSTDLTRGIRNPKDEGAQLTSAEVEWVIDESDIGRFVYNEVPSGTINGSNTNFTLAHTPTSGTLALYFNGQRLKLNSGFTLSGATITLTLAPIDGDELLADYRYV